MRSVLGPAPKRTALVLVLGVCLGLVGALPWASVRGQEEPTAAVATAEPPPLQPPAVSAAAPVPDEPSDVTPSLAADALPEENAAVESSEAAAEESPPLQPTEGPSEGLPAVSTAEPGSAEETAPDEPSDVAPSPEAGVLPAESAPAAPTEAATAPAGAAVEQSGDASGANPETVADLVASAPADNVEIVSIESVELAPEVDTAIETLVASSDELVVAAALVPVYDTPENVVAVLVGEGITFSNVGYVGATVALGHFTGGSGIVGFEAGIILSSGDIATVVGPNAQDGATTGHNTPGDTDLTDLVDTATFDAAVLTFDFVPQGNAVVFSYVFSSEEYNEYVNSEYNDVFAFYVNGVNCATVDGGRVSVNSINNGRPFGSATATNPELFINNDLTDGGGAVNTEMDGLTVVLTCEAAVLPGVTNTMKLAIADASDRILDSNVFIQAESLVVVTPTPVATATPTAAPGPTATPTPVATATPTPGAGSTATATPPLAPGATATATPPTTSAAGGVTRLPDAGVGGQEPSANGLLVGLVVAGAAGLLLVVRRRSAKH